ncbi:MAG TPA: ABC transporter substrate-binding protein [Acidimicrobiales bacterium]
MRARTRGAVLAAALLLAMASAACGGGGDDDGDTSGGQGASALGDNVIDGPQENEGEPVTGGSITVGLESETNTYLPSQFQGSQAGYNVAYAVFDPLVTRDADGEIQPYLAESIEPNDDFTQWTLTLRSGVTFHDGTPLNAEAMKRIFDDYLTADGALTRSALRDVDRMEIVDDLTVRYVLNQPNAAFPDVLALPAGWPFSPDAADEAGDAFGEHPVGTGPFKFVSWQRDGALVLERNEDYWQEGLPYLDRITFRAIPDEETRATSLASGDVDAVQSVRLSSFVTRVQDIPGVEIALGMNNGGQNIMFNTSEPPVDDARVRRALAHAVDQQALVDVVAGDAAAVTELRTQFFASDSPWYSEWVAEAWPDYDPERAQQLIDEYVNDPERSDGKPVGSPVTLELDTTNVPSLIEQATAYQGFWEEIGVEASIRPVEQSVHITEALTGDYQIKSFRAGLDQDPLPVFEGAFGDPEQFVTNFTNYRTPEIEQALETLRTTDDPETRAAAVEEVGLQLAEDLPIYWTGSDIPLIAYADDIEGVAGWTLPDGSLGDGATPAITFWSQVWVAE